jgi:hypothetical protein
MPALLDIRSLLKSRREERAGDVFDMARRLVRNESVDPDELFAAMTAAGMDDDGLTALVDMIARRSDYRAVAKKLPDAEKELASVRDGIRRQREALEEAERRYRKAVEPMLAQEQAAEARVADATRAASALLSPTNLPASIVSRIEEAREGLHEADAKVREVQSEIDRQERRAEAGLEVLDGDGGFDKWHSQYNDPQRRPYMNEKILAAVENVRGGRHRVAEAAKRLEEVVAARDAAKAAYVAAENAAREF